MEHEKPALDAEAVAKIAGRASVDIRTIYKRLAGVEVRGLAGERADAAIAEWRAENGGGR